MPENNPITDAELAEVKRLWERRKESEVDQLKWRQSSGICFPAILARLEAAEREREELRRWRELHKDNTDCPDCNGTAIGCETCTESGLVGIYQRDAKQRREGAAEAWDIVAERSKLVGDTAGETYATEAAKRLREGGE